LLAVPVVNEENRLLGIVTVDDAHGSLEEENTEDIHKMAGITPEEDIALTTLLYGVPQKEDFMAYYMSYR
jgi:magnesium transporter